MLPQNALLCRTTIKIGRTPVAEVAPHNERTISWASTACSRKPLWQREAWRSEDGRRAACQHEELSWITTILSDNPNTGFRLNAFVIMTHLGSHGTRLRTVRRSDRESLSSIPAGVVPIFPVHQGGLCLKSRVHAHIYDLQRVYDPPCDWHVNLFDVNWRYPSSPMSSSRTINCPVNRCFVR